MTNRPIRRPIYHTTVVGNILIHTFVCSFALPFKVMRFNLDCKTLFAVYCVISFLLYLVSLAECVSSCFKFCKKFPLRLNGLKEWLFRVTAVQECYSSFSLSASSFHAIEKSQVQMCTLRNTKSISFIEILRAASCT